MLGLFCILALVLVCSQLILLSKVKMVLTTSLATSVVNFLVFLPNRQGLSLVISLATNIFTECFPAAALPALSCLVPSPSDNVSTHEYYSFLRHIQKLT